VVAVEARRAHAGLHLHGRGRIAPLAAFQVLSDLQACEGGFARDRCWAAPAVRQHKQQDPITASLPACPPACLTSAGTCPLVHPAGSGALAEPQTLINTFWPCSLAVLITKLQAGRARIASRAAMAG
jgi:hypothetical protein